MLTVYLIKVVWVFGVETLAFALALIKYCWVAKSIAGLPNIRENSYKTNPKIMLFSHFLLKYVKKKLTASSDCNVARSYY